MSKIDFVPEAEALREEMVAVRRDLHMHPETAFEEVRTAGIVAQTLSSLGLEVQTGVGKTGVVAMLDGSDDGPTVLVRADMDALPIEEANKVDYVSQTAGKMHACGHDAHTAIGLAVAKMLTKHKDRIHGRVKFVFQPAEEIARGAQAMIEDGALANPRPDVSLGLHVWNTLPLGRLGVADGPTMAGSSLWTATLTGKGAHGAAPHLGIDPVVCAAHIITALQTIVSRNVDPMDTAVVSATQVHAGDTHNVIPQTAVLTGTMRSFKTEVRDLVTQRMDEIIRGVAASFGCEADFQIEHRTGPVVNHADVGNRLRPLFSDIVGADNLDLTTRTMGGEDMSFFMTDVPGMYFFVGSANEARGLNYGHHHPQFDIDEDVLPLGAALLATAVAEYVIPG
ncbi:MAG: amidohydrolase [Anaerolineae bacterium]|nr:MAG: peptidase M20 family hydrolase [Chloroflexi bacterium OLB13]MBC6954572.1 amidohydrolase [Chloroflexota bacterium]MBV6434809.1 putative hydrolase YxeP [Anaerolineae bacterium]MDL1914365.1 amidohydrolase [Anaerolineae bacterium CFX4]MBW7878493.1 amidohydrolase [Anaerolineae bacterium]